MRGHGADRARYQQSQQALNPEPDTRNNTLSHSRHPSQTMITKTLFSTKLFGGYS
jgi:hypothetical protein